MVLKAQTEEKEMQKRHSRHAREAAATIQWDCSSSGQQQHQEEEDEEEEGKKKDRGFNLGQSSGEHSGNDGNGGVRRNDVLSTTAALATKKRRGHHDYLARQWDADQPPVLLSQPSLSKNAWRK